MCVIRKAQAAINDNPCVKSGLVHTLGCDEWPPCSPDINIIENLMAVVKMRVERRVAGLDDSVQHTVALYKKILSEEWAAVSLDHLRALYNSLPQRCHDIVELGGAALKC